MRLWYKQSAAALNEALPLGNGKLAAWVYGGSNLETIQIDDSTFWSGEKSVENNRSDTPAVLAELRQLLLDENYEQADQLGRDFIGRKNRYGTHMPMGNLLIRHERMGALDSLCRELDILTGITKTCFTSKNENWRRECFVSHPQKVFALRYQAEKPILFSTTIEFMGIDNDVHTQGMQGKDLLIRGHAWETLHSDGRTGVSVCGRVRIITDGVLRQKSTWARVENATWMVLLLAAETTLFESDPDRQCLALLDQAEQMGYEAIKQEHIRDVEGMMNRVSLTLGSAEMDALSTDERIEAYAVNRGGDPRLDALIFQYGRYVLLASSREDSPLPTHMGGIWNDNVYNKQDSTQDMHIDVNVEMQYWPAYPCALSECANPLDKWLKDTMVPSGQKTACEEYDARGWVAHVTSNPWGYTSLGWAYNWGSFTFGGAWCATLLWDRFEYTQDQTYLKDAWPILRGCAEFILDYLFYDKKSGYYMSGPSYSPENHFKKEGRQYVLSLSTTCDIILIREMLSIVKKTVQELQLKEKDFINDIDERLSKLPPFQIGQHGQLQEWFYDFEEAIPNHRHTSHLLGLYPFRQLENKPELKKAARISMERRYRNFEVTSWGFAQFVSMYARLLDGEAAMSVLADDVEQLAKPNLTFVMPEYENMWGGTWELDGNTGLCTALCELLAQSYWDETDKKYHIHLLPALPSAWAEGELKGYRLRGGYSLDMTWTMGKLVHAELHTSKALPFDVLVNSEKRLYRILQIGTYVIE